MQSYYVNARHRQRLDTNPQSTWRDRDQVKYIGAAIVLLIAYAYYNQGTVNSLNTATWSINNLLTGVNSALDELQELIYKFRTLMK